ncbi:hydroxyisourate hydrolase [Acinetobacter sp. ANC 5383]
MISTHILDTHLGKPAAAVTVKLFEAASHKLLGQGQTDVDGRLKDFGLTAITAGEYQLEYEILPYFASKQLETFFTKVCIQFYVADPQEHYHVPLLISPFAYSTYRGS